MPEGLLAGLTPTSRRTCWPLCKRRDQDVER
jgi:hypothetical protein